MFFSTLGGCAANDSSRDHCGSYLTIPEESGRASALAEASVEASDVGQELVLERDGAAERYVAGPLGLEQSYRIDQPTGGDGPIVFVC